MCQFALTDLADDALAFRDQVNDLPIDVGQRIAFPVALAATYKGLFYRTPANVSKPVCRSVVVVTPFTLRVTPPIVVIATVLVPVALIPVVVVVPRAIVNSVVPAMVVASLPAKDLVQLPPGQVMIVT